MERSIETKAIEQAEKQLCRKRKLEFKAEELRQHQQFQAMLLQQQQQQQQFQQQQQMNIAKLTTLVELLKKNNLTLLVTPYKYLWSYH